jgi:hypothetical protein
MYADGVNLLGENINDVKEKHRSCIDSGEVVGIEVKTDDTCSYLVIDLPEKIII